MARKWFEAVAACPVASSGASNAGASSAQPRATARVRAEPIHRARESDPTTTRSRARPCGRSTPYRSRSGVEKIRVTGTPTTCAAEHTRWTSAATHHADAQPGGGGAEPTGRVGTLPGHEPGQRGGGADRTDRGEVEQAAGHRKQPGGERARVREPGCAAGGGGAAGQGQAGHHGEEQQRDDREQPAGETGRGRTGRDRRDPRRTCLCRGHSSPFRRYWTTRAPATTRTARPARSGTSHGGVPPAAWASAANAESAPPLSSAAAEGATEKW